VILSLLLLLNPIGTIFNFYEMKPRYTYILLKDLLIPIQMIKFLLNEIIIHHYYILYITIHSKTFSLPTKVVILPQNIIQNIMTKLRYLAQFKCYHKKLKSN